MKKNLTFILASAALCALALSCAREPMNPMDPAEPEDPREETASPITIRATVEELTTRVDFTPSYTGGKPASMALTWAEGDKLRVYDHADRSRYSDFELKAGSIGQEVGEFTGIPVQASSYDLEVINGTFDYAAQTQPSDGVTTGLKYLASASGVSASALESVTFTEFSSVLAITAKMPSTAIAAGIKSVELLASDNIFDAGNTLTVTFDTVGDADGDAILHFFATLPQGDQAIAEGTTMLVRFHAPGTDHTVYTRFCPLSMKTFTANELNTININASKSDLYANYTTQAVGTADNPYLIGDKYQMQAVHEFVDDDALTYFKMVDDVDLESEPWVALNLESPWSKAIDFNGNGHTVSHLVSVGSDDNAYPGFAGILKGSIHDVTFDSATVTCGSYRGGVVAGYVGSSTKGFMGNCTRVYVTNTQVTSESIAGVLAAVGDNLGTFTHCGVSNSSVTSSAARVGGLIGSIVSFTELSDCFAESVTVESGSYYAGGLVGQVSGGGDIVRCYATGSVASNHTSYSRSGGLVGYLINGSVKNCYSECSVNVQGQYCGGLVGQIKEGTVTGSHVTGAMTSANHYFGGVVGLIEEEGEATVRRCYFDGTITLPSNKAQSGGIVTLVSPSASVTISDCYSKGTISARRWCGGIIGGVNASATSVSITNCYTSMSIPNGNNGALIGACDLAADKVSVSGFIAGWASGNLVATGNTPVPDTYYIGTGVHINTKAVEFGWDGSIWDLNVDEPTLKDSDDPVIPEPEETENPDYTGNNVWSGQSKGTTTTLRPGVQWTTYHGKWEGQYRTINIIRTTLDDNNHLGVFYDYYTDGLKYLNEKCDYLDAVAGTNGSMACCHFVRVDLDAKHPATNTSSTPYLANCALTIDDGNQVNIVKVKDNYAAARLPNKTVSCAGPLLVWKGNKLTAPQEWLDIDAKTEDRFLTNTHPRTAIGLTKDGKTVIQVTVDGRWTSSNTSNRAIGMSTDLLAELMKQLGCYNAMNFDGGGGTQMWVADHGDIHHIVNHPHNEWPTYGCGSNTFYYNAHEGEVARRTTGCAVYIK